jgi:hypothetical protein
VNDSDDGVGGSGGVVGSSSGGVVVVTRDFESIKGLEDGSRGKGAQVSDVLNS